MSNLIYVAYLSALIIAIYNGVSARPNNDLANLDDAPIHIVNGTDAKDGELPYVVQLRDNTKYFECGGSIIGDKWILTAGHCVDGTNITTIVYGTNLLYDRKDTDTVIKVKKQYQHPKFYYNRTSSGNVPLYDIAVLELDQIIPFNNKTQPLRLPSSDVVPFHISGVLSGWGFNATNGNVKTNLQKINLELLTDQECYQKIAVQAPIFNAVHNLCSNDNWNGECYGDSGGPYVINGTQYGVVSWSIKPCGSSPGTYSRISNPEYRQFIKNITGI